ncbi:sensor histidine kinase [Streptococcus saliviloxodontae]|uniref:Sensor histidine kinase n=1 Tax=Streptococcus saliviloxodontae TaxID=1349416 RepID=A0ABS2PNB7_9STRE|nr:sensor histidine kinase [Streptococcus saliviloxodontae]MBM7636782.1 NarL family two-component system sensor histidine kinase LiaS [Streptococcus saliviloxodontae]
MKKQQIVLLFFYAFVTVITIVFIIFDSFDLSLKTILSRVDLLNQFIFSILLLTFSLTIMLVFVAMLSDYNSKRIIHSNIKRILSNRGLIKDNSEIGYSLQLLSLKMNELTRRLQETENAPLMNSEEIVMNERKRIARDLHDTVSQELFAASMLVSGTYLSLEQLSQEQLKTQLQATEEMINGAQKDLRILLLHLRPTELEGRTLSEGFRILIQELSDKSNIQVTFKENVSSLPKTIEENLFRIAQEFISNTLKHSKAKHLEIYLNQSDNEVQLKMTDDGVGFDINQERSLSYGLTNIEDRVNDLAGRIKLLSSPNQGVSMDIRVPLMKGENSDENDSDSN